jgi:hypothetical protein
MSDENAVTTEEVKPVETTVETGVVEEPTKPVEEPIVEEPEPPKTVPLAALEAERKKRQEASEQVAYWKGRAEATPAAPVKEPEPVIPQTPQRPAKPVKPRAEQFDEWADFERAESQYEQVQDKYERDLESYMIEKADYEVTQRLEQRVTQQSQQKTQAEIDAAFDERLKKAAETDPELLDIIAHHHQPGPHQMSISPVMAECMKESDIGPEMLRHLANNKDIAKKLAQMNPLTAAREMGKIEAAIIATPKAPVKKISGAPEPITTLAPKGAAEAFNPETASMAEYAEWRQKQLLGNKT